MTAGHLRRLAHRATGVAAPGALLPRVPSLFEPVGPGGPPAPQWGSSMEPPSEGTAAADQAPDAGAGEWTGRADIRSPGGERPVARPPADPRRPALLGAAQAASGHALRTADPSSAPTVGGNGQASGVPRPAPGPAQHSPEGEPEVVGREAAGSSGPAWHVAVPAAPLPDPRPPSLAGKADVVGAVPPGRSPAAARGAASSAGGVRPAVRRGAHPPDPDPPRVLSPHTGSPDEWPQGHPAGGVPRPSARGTVAPSGSPPIGGRHRGAGREEATVVQVTIGSIEVRASAPAVPAEPQPAGRTDVPEPPVSLERYLVERVRR